MGVPDGLGPSPGSEVAYLFTGKTPVALKPEIMLQGVIALRHATESSCEIW